MLTQEELDTLSPTTPSTLSTSSDANENANINSMNTMTEDDHDEPETTTRLTYVDKNPRMKEKLLESASKVKMYDSVNKMIVRARHNNQDCKQNVLCPMKISAQKNNLKLPKKNVLTRTSN